MSNDPASPAALYSLFQADRLVAHTMPVEVAIKARPQQLSSNRSQLKSGSILFWRGLQHEDGHHIPNAVARFGDPEHAQRTVFATLHDLRAIFDTHGQLEQQKAPDKQRGAPFVLFSNSDIGNLAKEQPPPDDYMDAVWGQSQPVKTLRPVGFNFREYCSTKREKDDPSMEEEGVEWNELRAVLNRNNMVGLLYIHDPSCSPQQHADEARQLLSAFDGKYHMGVFRLTKAGGVQGDLLTVPCDDESAGSLDQQQQHGKGQQEEEEEGKEETAAAAARRIDAQAAGGGGVAETGSGVAGAAVDEGRDGGAPRGQEQRPPQPQPEGSALGGGESAQEGQEASAGAGSCGDGGGDGDGGATADVAVRRGSSKASRDQDRAAGSRGAGGPAAAAAAAAGSGHSSCRLLTFQEYLQQQQQQQLEQQQKGKAVGNKKARVE